MKKILLLLPLFMLESCHTPDENIAIDFLKNHCKSPSSFKLIKCESNEYTSDNDVKYDTSFYYKDSWIYPIYENAKYDSISVEKRWYENSKATWVDVTFEASNAFGVMLKNYETVIVRNGRASTLMDDLASRQHKEVEHTEKFAKPQKY